MSIKKREMRKDFQSMPVFKVLSCNAELLKYTKM